MYICLNRKRNLEKKKFVVYKKIVSNWIGVFFFKVIYIIKEIIVFFWEGMRVILYNFRINEI